MTHTPSSALVPYRTPVLSSFIMATLVMITVLLASCGRSETSPQTARTAPASNPIEDTTRSPETVGEWDVVVLGQIHMCGVCQRGSPKVSYTKVLAGEVPHGQTAGTLALAEVATHLLPTGGVPIYESQQDEIIFLKGVKDKDLYTVVGVLKATPENLALFHNR
jgi:hypothetical protein